ncbi:PAS domain-containing protein [Erythrobacter sp. SCSIO 43205]|uniref:sensor histidine kinase n=1 Tax=Erythrobacter sp. SCSIO 43205 TaxID=2779361 RepID=UPI001CA9F4FB|nr:HWE histidine kinase domain-containing protein [Erythrobacter sp. SCSIO 43205]UAB78123.1 PAS domain-containing protein [Erythrobacter sp. SCSIO 43205]
MIEDTDLDQEAQKALAEGRAITREVVRDGRAYTRTVKPYTSGVGGVMVTYEPCEPRENTIAAHQQIVQSLAASLAQIGVWIFDPQAGEAIWDDRSAPVTGLEKAQHRMSEKTFAEHIVSQDRTSFTNAMDAAIHEGTPLDLELRFKPPGRDVLWLRMRGERAMRADEPIVVCILADVSETEANRTRSDFMMRELDHRVNNLLAIILSIAEISARSNTDLTTYAKDFRARLESMARTHSLLAQTQWSGPSLRALIEKEINAHAAQDAVHLEGPDITLSPSAAQSLAMFFHELAANASKHGALSGVGGRVDILWNTQAGEEPVLELRWQESGGPTVARPERDGFGGKVINRIITRQLYADVSTQWNEAGICLTARIPMARICLREAD